MGNEFGSVASSKSAPHYGDNFSFPFSSARSLSCRVVYDDNRKAARRRRAARGRAIVARSEALIWRRASCTTTMSAAAYCCCRLGFFSGADLPEPERSAPPTPRPAPAPAPPRTANRASRRVAAPITHTIDWARSPAQVVAATRVQLWSRAAGGLRWGRGRGPSPVRRVGAAVERVPAAAAAASKQLAVLRRRNNRRN